MARFCRTERWCMGDTARLTIGLDGIPPSTQFSASLLRTIVFQQMKFAAKFGRMVTPGDVQRCGVN